MLTFSVIPERLRPVVAGEISPRVLANRSTFPTGTKLLVDVDLVLTSFANVSTFGASTQLIEGVADASIAPTVFTNVSTFGSVVVSEDLDEDLGGFDEADIGDTDIA